MMTRFLLFCVASSAVVAPGFYEKAERQLQFSKLFQPLYRKAI